MSENSEPVQTAPARPVRKVRPSNRQTAAVIARRKEQRRQLLKWLGAGMALAVVAAALLVFLDHRSQASGAIPGGPTNASTVVAGPVVPSDANPRAWQWAIPMRRSPS